MTWTNSGIAMDTAFKRIAVDWCEANEIAYVDDAVEEPKPTPRDAK